MPNKIVTVIKREYMTRVKSKGFMVSLFLMPVLMCGLMLLSGFFAIMEDKTAEMRKLAVIDETGEIFAQMQAAITGSPAFQHKGELVYEFVEESAATEASETTLRERVTSKDLYAYLAIPKDVFANGEVRFYARTATNFEVQRAVRRMISDIVRDTRFAESGYSQHEVSQLMRSVKFNAYAVKSSKGDTGSTEVESPIETGARLGLGYILVFVLYMFVIIYANSIMRSVLEEKTTRIVEVIVSSIKPYQLLLGKLVGVCSVCLTMFAIWVLFGVLLVMNIEPLLGIFSIDGLPIQLIQVIETIKASSAGVLTYFFIYFIIGFFMYSTLYAVVGAICGSEEEAQQTGAPLTVLIVVPFILMFQLFRIPDSTISVLLSHVPFFSPILMFMRINVLMPPLWEILLNIFVVCATVLLVTLISGKIYRVGILMYGKRPTLAQLWQWARY
ncbi:ABC transporter permease [Candidatus Poribacteria bacterium]|nr:ABC transporter permease [Candidatus Poribacteria bacterium]MYK20242.1 ABC transporter permease [Candidatus Poribacteria bacterium]